MGPATTASVLIVLLGLLGPSSQQGRVAPGVPPQQYGGGQQMGQMPPQHHQPPPVQHHQQPPMQHHQQPPIQHHQQPPVQHHQQMQHQQVPMQQVPVHQQVPVQQQHQYGQPQVPVHHAVPPQQILNAAHMAQEKDHIKEHLDVPIDTSNMSEQELQFHYFKMHDADNNNKLDGCELIKSLIHWHVEHQGTHENAMENFTDQDLSSILDQMLSKADKDNDGYLNYSEFVGSTGIKVDTH